MHARRIKGVPVTLYERTRNGKDLLNADTYAETPVTVDNVLIAPASTDDIADEQSLNGRRADYTLYIPKGDAHAWEGCRVGFFGRIWQAVGVPQALIESLVPLDWNKTVKVVLYE